jgi:hypothetical protein
LRRFYLPMIYPLAYPATGAAEIRTLYRITQLNRVLYQALRPPPLLPHIPHGRMACPVLPRHGAPANQPLDSVSSSAAQSQLRRAGSHGTTQCDTMCDGLFRCICRSWPMQEADGDAGLLRGARFSRLQGCVHDKQTMRQRTDQRLCLFSASSNQLTPDGCTFLGSMLFDRMHCVKL